MIELSGRNYGEGAEIMIEKLRKFRRHVFTLSKKNLKLVILCCWLGEHGRNCAKYITQVQIHHFAN